MERCASGLAVKEKFFVLKTVWKSEEICANRWKAYAGQNRLFFELWKNSKRHQASPVGDCKNSDQNNAKGTGSASVFGFLTEAFFLLFKNCWWEEFIWIPSLQAAHGHWEIRNIFNCDLKRNFDSFCLGTSLRTICHFDPKAFEFYIIAEKMRRLRFSAV